MSSLNSLFDVVRGWTGTGTDSACITETFRPDPVGGAGLREGHVVVQSGDGRVVKATGLNYAGAGSVSGLAELLAESQQFWLVVDGNDTAVNYDTLIQTGPVGANGTLTHVPWKVTCIRGTYMFETERFAAGTYSPGDKVTVIDGVPDLTKASAGANAGFQPFGEVRAFSAASGLLTVCV